MMVRSARRQSLSGTRVRRSRLHVLLTLLLLFAPGKLNAQKTDVITVRNGDLMTGEMKSLDRGLLVFKTDVAQTINVEWPKVELYDSRPPSIDANQNDFSLTTSLGWKF